MSFSYGVRAAILCFGFFFLLNAALGLVVSTIGFSRSFGRMNPRSAARILFMLRLVPSVFALVLTCLIIAPAYFQWEGQIESEEVGVLITLAAACGVSIWMQSLVRAGRALYESFRVPRQVLETDDLFLAVAGIARPRIIVSRGFLESIPAEHRDVAMRHELAHYRAGDNLRRLLMLLAPPIIPGWNFGFASLEEAWVRYSERAADDDAVDGDAHRATLLAELLVTMSRKHCRNRSLLACALVGSTVELRVRVERLCMPSASRKQGENRALALVSTALLLSPLILAALAQGVSAELFHWIELLLLHV